MRVQTNTTYAYVYSVTLIRPGIPVVSVRLVMLTVLPKRQYLGIRFPITPVTTSPEWIPIVICCAPINPPESKAERRNEQLLVNFNPILTGRSTEPNKMNTETIRRSFVAKIYPRPCHVNGCEWQKLETLFHRLSIGRVSAAAVHDTSLGYWMASSRQISLVTVRVYSARKYSQTKSVKINSGVLSIRGSVARYFDF